MCREVKRLPGKRVSGVLCRDKVNTGVAIIFLGGATLTDHLELFRDGTWTGDAIESCDFYSWTLEQWKNQYGKLPRKGSKESVINRLKT